jgi:hypothetical protein
MIIFDLDGCLANCEHRRHFVDPRKSINHILQGYDSNGRMIEEAGVYCNILTGERFKPDWQAFYEACDKDTPIQPTIEIMRNISEKCLDIQIWSGRCESVKEKTIDWLHKYVGFDFFSDGQCPVLKMRPIGDSTPDDELKERWLDEALSEGKKIDFVFDDRPKVIRTWRRRGIFVFNCCQSDEEF